MIEQGSKAPAVKVTATDGASIDLSAPGQKVVHAEP